MATWRAPECFMALDTASWAIRYSSISTSSSRRTFSTELAQLTETPPGRPTLAPEADLRLALDRAAVFAALDEPQPVVEGGG